METLQLVLALATLAGVVGFGTDLLLGARGIESLKDMRALGARDGPRVSVIVSARNEEDRIEEALHSLLRQDYGNFEILAVDDRSTDRTGAILDRVSEKHPELRVIHVRELPRGWLGKNHALHKAAFEATGEYLLFTDADVVMRPDTLAGAVSTMREKRWDHLAVAPEVNMPGVLLNLVFVFFMVGFSLYARPWKAEDPRSSSFVGIGAFNMIRREVYRAMGGHEAIAMRPDDDMKLGKLVKKRGYRQGFLDGRGTIAVQWYSTFGEMLWGMEKNAFAGLDYSLLNVIGISLLIPAVFVWPFAGVFCTGSAVRVLNLSIVAIVLFFALGGAARAGVRWTYALGTPVAALLFLAVIWNSTGKAIVHRGINWRGTVYPLDELKANKV